MNRFTIDADFISLAGLDDNVDLLLDVLMVFTQDNEFRLCLDTSDIAFQKYLNVSIKLFDSGLTVCFKINRVENILII